MSWTDPVPELSAEEKFEEQLKKLSHRDQTVTIAVMALMWAFKEHDSVEPSLFKDLSFQAGLAIKQVTTMDTLEFLLKQLDKAPAATTLGDVKVLIGMMGLQTQKATDKALSDLSRLTALLPQEESDAGK